MRSFSYATAVLIGGLFAIPASAQASLTGGSASLQTGPEYYDRGGIALTQSTSLEITGSSVACGAEIDGVRFTTENNYARVFDLETVNLPGPIRVVSIDFGAGAGRVEARNSFDTNFTIGRLNAGVDVTAMFTYDDFTRDEEMIFPVTNDIANGVYNVVMPGMATFAPTDRMVVQWETPDGTGTDENPDDLFAVRFAGNDAGEQAPTYLGTFGSCGLDFLQPVDAIGDFANSNWVLVVNAELTVATEAGPAGTRIAIGLTAPNPAVAVTRVPFSLQATSDVRLSVFDALGREVAVLAQGTFGAGDHSVDLAASGLAPGTYVVRLQTGDSVVTRTISVVR